jgi:hypothetical protein
VVEKEKMIFESFVRKTQLLEYPDDKNDEYHKKMADLQVEIAGVKEERQKQKVVSNKLLLMLLEPEGVADHKFFSIMFEAQHFPLKIPTNEYTFDLITKKLDGHFGDQNLKDYRAGPIMPSGQRLRLRDCRKKRTSRDKTRDKDRKTDKDRTKTDKDRGKTDKAKKDKSRKKDKSEKKVDIDKYERYLDKLERQDGKKLKKK